jgi:hypothetical protein
VGVSVNHGKIYPNTMAEQNRLTREQAQEKLNQLVAVVANKRAALYQALRTDNLDKEAPDYEEQLQIRGTLLIQTLHRWAKSPLAFIEEAAWAPDRKGQFGSGFIPKGLGLPANMVPIIPYPQQRELIEKFPEMLRNPYACAMVAVKSRQVAFTTIFMWLALWAWLFTEHGAGVITTYEEDLVDGGGKGQRTPDTLFGRLRMYLDSLISCLPDLRFNPNAARGKSVDNMIASGLSSSEDVGGKLTRPQWIVHGNRMFPEAEGNYLVGDLPSDSFGRSFSVNFVMMDEIGQYDQKRNGLAKKTWNAAASATKVRFAWGTIPETGGTGSFFYNLMHPNEDVGDDSDVMTRLFCHWSDIVPYMAGASWVCPVCDHRNEHEVQPGPGPDGHEKTCGHCGHHHLVRYHDMTSPWFEQQCKLMLGDKVGIARELQMDWMAAQGDVLFSTLDARSLVIPFRDSGDSITIEGFDPGQSMKNAGAWVCGRYSPKVHRLCQVGYWMSINPHPEYWVPFMKHWHPAQTRRNRLVYGKFAGRTFMEAFDYPDEALRMLEVVSKYPLGDIRGDKYGSHGTPGRTTYDVLMEYGIYVDWEKTADREELVRNGIEWAARVSVAREIEKVEAPTPLGGRFPSLVTAYQTAKPKDYEGESRRVLDVSKKEPSHVHNFVDAYLYQVRDLEQVHAMVDAGGLFTEEPYREAEIIEFGDELPGV